MNLAMSTLERYRDGLRLFRAISPQIRASQLDLLITIHLCPGINQTDLAIECDLTLSAVSRAVDVFSSSGRRDGKGGALGLLEGKRIQGDDRSISLHLTAKGRQLIQLLQEMNSGSKA